MALGILIALQPVMRSRLTTAALLLATTVLRCTGGQEGTAAEEKLPERNPPSSAATVDPREVLRAISPAIPLYADAHYRDDLTRRDQVLIRSQYGARAEVYTLASDDSYPQVFHYYLTYLAQFRSFPPQDPYPPQRENWRTREIQLNQAMQDPFIPGDALQPDGKQVILQIAETEAEPRTVIRYIVTPPGPVPTTPASVTPVAATQVAP